MDLLLENFPICHLPFGIRKLVIGHLFFGDTLKLLDVNRLLRNHVLAYGVFEKRVQTLKMDCPNPTIFHLDGTTQVFSWFRNASFKSISSVQEFELTVNEGYQLGQKEISQALLSSLKLIGTLNCEAFSKFKGSNTSFTKIGEYSQEVARFFSNFEAKVINKAKLSLNLKLMGKLEEIEKISGIYAELVKKNLKDCNEIEVPATIELLEALRETNAKSIHLSDMRNSQTEILDIVDWILMNGVPTKRLSSSLSFSFPFGFISKECMMAVERHFEAFANNNPGVTQETNLQPLRNFHPGFENGNAFAIEREKIENGTVRKFIVVYFILGCTLSAIQSIHE